MRSVHSPTHSSRADEAVRAKKAVRKHLVLSRHIAAVTDSIAEATVIKEGNIFFLCDSFGNVPLTGRHGFGLYYQDCRFLKGYELKLAGERMQSLVSSSVNGFEAVIQLTAPEIRTPEETIPKDEVGVKWERVLDGESLCLSDRFTFHNFGHETRKLSLSLSFRAVFEDVFDVRGLLPKNLGLRRPVEWNGDELSFIYDGADELTRYLMIHFSLSPNSKEGTSPHFSLMVPPAETKAFAVTLSVSVTPRKSTSLPPACQVPDVAIVKREASRNTDEWIQQSTQVRSDSLTLNNVVSRSLRDLRILQSKLKDRTYFAAGLPWFATLFGRDSLITSLQTLAFNPAIAEGTLRLLADHQGQELDEFRDEEPGKILHELRTGELARVGEIPHSPYYGSVDATLLFLILIGRHASWTGDHTLFHELKSHVESALLWCDRTSDAFQTGYISYASHAKDGLVNQGWKDSGNAIVNSVGSMAAPPISLVEVQGYLYAAKLEIARLFHETGDEERSRQLTDQAENLRLRFNRDFWLEDRKFFALARQKDNKPVESISSNPGHALWSGIVDPEKAAPVVERLMSSDMFSGWGIRTLSSEERAYNPIGYHLGTVWPHDNSLIAAGLRRYGFDEAAEKIFVGLMEAAVHFSNNRLPELFAGFDREDYAIPVRYPVACHPQAWAAGAIPYLLQVMLGLEPQAFEKRLRLLRPWLPSFVQSVALYDLRVGKAKIDLKFTREADGRISHQVLQKSGDLELMSDGSVL